MRAIDKKFHYIWNDGRNAWYEPYTTDYDAAMPIGAKHFRVGRFAVVVGKGTFISAREYDEHILDDGRCVVGRDSKHFESHKKDRLATITLAATMIAPDHPHYDDLMADIKREREYFDDEGVPNTNENDDNIRAEVMAAALSGIREFERTTRGAWCIDNIQASKTGEITVRLTNGSDVHISSMII